MHALRTAAVEGATTMQEAIDRALRRKDRTIQWKHPDRPILPRFTGDGHLDLQSAAATNQLRLTLNEAAKLSGLAKRLRIHDIRRGAARDASRLPQQSSISNAQDELGHSNASTDAGTTKEYVGHLKKSTFSERLALDDFHSMGLRLEEVKPKRRKTDTFDRPALRQLSDSEANSGYEGGFEDFDHTETYGAWDEADIDPQLRILSDAFTSGQDAEAEDSPERLQEIGDALEEEAAEESTEEQNESSVLDSLCAPMLTFIDTFSRINIYRWERTQPRPGSVYRTIGSCDPPMPFENNCKNEQHGCTYKSANTPDLQKHELWCTPEKLAAKGKELEESTFTMSCDKEGCEFTCSAPTHQKARAKLNNHRKEHLYTPTKCTKGGHNECNQVFATHYAFRNHNEAYHSG